MSIGSRIRSERSRLGLSQAEFASLAGASRRAVIKWEQDDSSPVVTALAAWAEAGADALYIVTGRRSAPEQPHDAASQIEEQLSEIRRALLDPNVRRLPGDTEEQMEERAVSDAQSQLRAMLQYDRTFMSEDTAQEVEHLLDIAENPASLALYRAADHSQMRRQRREMRDRIAGWFNPERYVPNDTVLNDMVGQALEFGVPHKRLVGLVEEVFDDAADWIAGRSG